MSFDVAFNGCCVQRQRGRQAVLWWVEQAVVSVCLSGTCRRGFAGVLLSTHACAVSCPAPRPPLRAVLSHHPSIPLQLQDRHARRPRDRPRHPRPPGLRPAPAPAVCDALPQPGERAGARGPRGLRPQGDTLGCTVAAARAHLPPGARRGACRLVRHRGGSAGRAAGGRGGARTRRGGGAAAAARCGSGSAQSGGGGGGDRGAQAAAASGSGGGGGAVGCMKEQRCVALATTRVITRLPRPATRSTTK